MIARKLKMMTNRQLQILLSQYDDDYIIVFAGNTNTSFPAGPTTTGVTILQVQSSKFLPDADRHGAVLHPMSDRKGAVNCVTLY